MDAKNEFLEDKLERRLTKEMTLLDILHYETTGKLLDQSEIPFSKDDEQMLYRMIDQYYEWVDDFLNNSYEEEFKKIATNFYPEGAFTKEGFNEYQVEKAKKILKKSELYLKMAMQIISNINNINLKKKKENKI